MRTHTGTHDSNPPNVTGQAEDERMHTAEIGDGEAEAPADAHPSSDEAAAASRPAWAALHEKLMRDRGAAGPDEEAEEGVSWPRGLD